MSRFDVPHNLTKHFDTRTGTLELFQHIREGNGIDFAHLFEGRRALGTTDKQQSETVDFVGGEWGEVSVERLGRFAKDVHLLLECLEYCSRVVSGISLG